MFYIMHLYQYIHHGYFTITNALSSIEIPNICFPLFILVVIVSCILTAAYIKIRYPFWNIQPVYHRYDYLRQFYSTPFIICDKSYITKFCDFVQVRTKSFYDLSNQDKMRMVDILRCNYIPSDQVIYTINAKQIDNIFTGYAEIPYVSFFVEKEYKLSKPDSINPQSVLEIETGNIPFGMITSRAFHIEISPRSSLGKESISAYFLDFVCVKRDLHPEKQSEINRKMFQTHEYNQRTKNPSVRVSFFKKEVELCHGIVPLMTYKTYIYVIPTIKLLNYYVKGTYGAYGVKGTYGANLNKDVQVIRIYRDNLDILIDILGIYSEKGVTKDSVYDDFDLRIVPDISVIIEQIKTELMYVFVLKRKNDILAYYFLKNAFTCFESHEKTGNATLSLIASFCNMNNISIYRQDLFYWGFLYVLRDIMRIRNQIRYNTLYIDGISHNGIIAKKFSVLTNSSPNTHENAYYLYNYVIPWMPVLNESKCFVVI